MSLSKELPKIIKAGRNSIQEFLTENVNLLTVSRKIWTKFFQYLKIAKFKCSPWIFEFFWFSLQMCNFVPTFSIVGCGYGGFLISLGETFPDKISIGMEIRVKVSDYVQDRIEVLRILNPGKYDNIACIRTNSMKYLTNFFYKGQLSKMFFLYPDPHFKRSKHKWRIINPSLLSEYAYVLGKGVSWMKNF